MALSEIINITEFTEIFGEEPEPIYFDENIYFSDLSLIISSV